MQKLRFPTLVFLSAAVVAALGLSVPGFVGRLSYAVESAQAEVAREQLKTLQDLSLAFRTVAKAMRPSVVNISTLKRVKLGGQGGGDSNHPFFHGSPLPQFFGERGRHFFGGPGSPGPRYQEARGLGTGVVVNENGYIVTNNHVVSGVDKVTVKLTDGRTFDGAIVGRDEKTDLAILKIEASGLTPAPLGDSDSVEVGEWVLAVGNPFGLSETVTSGIVSAKGRQDLDIAEYENFIQTDAAINPGNSGGPLVNIQGEVIGINTAIASRTGTYAGVGFAIAVNMVREVMNQIIEDGKVVRGWLGVGIQDLTENLARSFGLEDTAGVLVSDSLEGGPAARAGIEAGDILLQFKDTKLRDSNHLRHLVAGTRAGTEVEVELVREGKTVTLSLEVAEREGSVETGTRGEARTQRAVGMTVRSLTPAMAEKLGYENTTGVLVTEVEQEGLAYRGGIRQGDVVLAVGGTRIESTHELRRALQSGDLDRGVRLQILRQGYRRFVVLKKD